MIIRYKVLVIMCHSNKLKRCLCLKRDEIDASQKKPVNMLDFRQTIFLNYDRR